MLPVSAPVQCVHVVPHVDDEASGPSYSVPRLCQSLAAQGQQVELLCLAAREAVPGVQVTVQPQWPVLRRFAVSPSLARVLRSRANEVDIVHNHSLWSMVNVAAGWTVPGRQARLVTSPRGTLSPWALAHSRRVKQAMWPLQRRALARADLLHATSMAEHDEIRALGLQAPILVVPNGIDLPELPASSMAAAADREHCVLFLSRIHPKKGIDLLLHAWVRLQATHPQWRLVIAGRGEPAHVEQVQALAAALGVQRVTFPGPLYGDAKSAAYAQADVFVLPTHSENFGMVVAEALAHGCPAVVSHGAPWAGLQTHDCGWWIELGVDGLATALAQAMDASPEARAAMGERGRQWMQRDFSWEAVGQRMAAGYEWLLRGGERPATVQLR
jgi:glycosyltransferase involved in cell wall biosynthesis